MTNPNRTETPVWNRRQAGNVALGRRFKGSMCLLIHERKLELRDKRGLAAGEVMHISDVWGTGTLAKKTKPNTTK